MAANIPYRLGSITSTSVPTERSATHKNPVQDFKSLTFPQDFKDFIARFQDYSAKKFHVIRSQDA